MHGSIGPSCAVAQFDDGAHDRVDAHAGRLSRCARRSRELLGMPPASVRCIHVEGSGCYGHNGADDVAADAALIARALPGRPVRVQWMREQEHAWEPYGPAMVTQRARPRSTPTAGSPTGNYDGVEQHPFDAARRGRRPAGRAAHRAQPFAPPAPRPLPLPEGGGDRNADPALHLPNAQVVHHFMPDDAAARLGAARARRLHNVFSIESFMDELARAAGADPVEFRLRHLDDRARPRGHAEGRRALRLDDALQAAARPRPRLCLRPLQEPRRLLRHRARGRGRTARPARSRLVRAVAAVDSGEVVNPDGIRNQIEGGIVQSLSWTLL